MSIKLVNLTKKPTKNAKSNYRRILEEVGKSDEPLSSYEIKKRVNGSGDIYRILEVLCPSILDETEKEIVFRWEDIVKQKNNRKYKRNLIEKINKSLKLDLPLHKTIDEEADIENNNLSININLIDGKENVIVIDVSNFQLFLLYDNDHVLVHVYKDKEKIKEANLKVKKNIRNKMNEVFTAETRVTGPRYLNITLSNNAQKKINKIFEIKKKENRDQPWMADEELVTITIPEARKIIYDRRNWRYSLNVRGLLMYLMWMSMEKRRNRTRIAKVLSNHSLIEEAPFLKYWTVFERLGLSIVDNLLNYCLELGSILDQRYYSDNYLQYIITDRYFGYVSGTISSVVDFHSLNEQDHKIIELNMRNYRIEILKLLRDYIIKELKRVNVWLNQYT